MLGKSYGESWTRGQKWAANSWAIQRPSAVRTDASLSRLYRLKNIFSHLELLIDSLVYLRTPPAFTSASQGRCGPDASHTPPCSRAEALMVPIPVWGDSKIVFLAKSGRGLGVRCTCNPFSFFAFPQCNLPHRQL